MAWFITQSLLVILATFALGLVIGWLWWGRAWRRVPLGESGAVRTVSARYEATIADRDAELVRLANAHAAQTPSTAPQTGTAAEPGPDGDSAPATDATTAEGAPLDAATADAGPEAPDGTGADAPEPTETVPDDLERIEGVGPRIAAALAGAGLLTYRDVAAADEEHLSAALRAAGLAFAPSLVTWPRQARLLAEGDEPGLAALQAEVLSAASRTDRPATGSGAGTDADAPESSGSTEEPAGAATSTPSAAAAAPATTAAATSGPAAPSPASRAGTATPVETAAPAQSAESAQAAAQADGTQESAAGPAPDGGAPADADQAQDAPEPEEDELERVEGIGPRIATALRKAGIQTYRQLAEADAPTLQAALSASGLRFAPSLPTWSRQAAFLADGDEAGFLALTRTLVPERENGRPS